MEISILSSIPTPSSSLPFSSSNSLFFNSNSISTRLPTPRTDSSLVLTRIRTRNERPRRGLSCNCLFGLGVPELVVIAGVAALVFGPKKLPEIGKTVGKTFKSFQQAAKEFESELKKEPDPPTDAPLEKSAALSEEDKQDGQVSSSKESL